jgi:Poly(ADP-ribose) polymerase catalytic domain
MSPAKLVTVPLSSPVFEEVEDAVRASYPKSCILWVNKVENDRLRNAYEQQKTEIANKRGFVKEMRLFHGTSEEALNAIVHYGFDPDRNMTSAFGRGTYFAVSASYSKDYAKPKKNQISFMLLCDVLVGICCQGMSNQVIDITKYDNAVNHIEKPSIYVTPYKYAAYPSYVIAFHREAL